MKAWLVTWEWMSDSAAVADTIAAILPPRWSADRVADYVEFLYALATSNVRELASYAKNRNNNPYRAKVGEQINGVPHGDRVTCGNHPWLYARPVSDFKAQADYKTDREVITWREPDTYKWKANQRGFELAQKGTVQQHTRQVGGTLQSDQIWDRKNRGWKKGFRRPDV